MRLLNRILSLIVLAGIVTMCINCKTKTDPEPDTVEKQQISKLLGQWDVTSVSVDGTDRTDFMPNVMTISGTYADPASTYNFSFDSKFPEKSPMPRTGAFVFGSPATENLLRKNDDLPMKYVLSNGDKNLTFTFTYNGVGFAGGRVSQVKGDWTFTFTRKN